jgi:mono/diheme cytochrome c family protein
VAGDWLVTAASYPQSRSQKAQIIALRIGGADTLPAPAEPPGADGGAGGGQGGGADQGGGGGGQGQPSDAQLAAGKQVFTSNCGSCHTLADAGTSGSVGPNLDQLQPPADEVEEQVRNGGGGMPAFEGRLSDDQIANVSAYVAQVADPNAEGGGAGSGP